MNNGEKALSFTDLAGEAERGKQLWFREYMHMGRFSTCYMREANLLTDAAHVACKMLEDSNVNAATRVLKKAASDAGAIRLSSVQPSPAPKDVRKAFLWMAEKEGMNLNANADGLFHSPATQRAWAMFQQGATWAEKRMQQPEAVEAPPARKRWLA